MTWPHSRNSSSTYQASRLMTDGVIDMTETKPTQEEQAALLAMLEEATDFSFLDKCEAILIRRRTPKVLFFRLLESFKVGEELNAEEWKALERAVTPKHNHHKAH
jgi:hypothetical protein